MINLTIQVPRDRFDATCLALTDEQAQEVVTALPHLFDPRGAPEKPGPAKTKPPKVAVDFSTAKALVHNEVKIQPGERAPFYAARASLDGKLVKRALTALVAGGSLYQDGSGRGARYKPRPQNGAVESA